MNRRVAVFALFVLAAAGAILLAALHPPSGKSRQLGIFPALDIYRWVSRPWGPFVAAGIMVLIDYLATIAISGWVEGVWRIPNYWPFKYNDPIFIPLMILGVALVLRHWTPSHAWYTQPWWHLAVFALGYALVAGLNCLSISSGDTLWAQFWSPRIVWHTLIFGVVFYWLGVMVPPLFATLGPRGAVALVAIGFVGFAAMVVLDFTKPLLPYSDARIFNWKTGKAHDRVDPIRLAKWEISRR